MTEITIHWFSIFILLITIFTIYSGYRAFPIMGTKFSKTWMAIFILMLIIAVYKPFKMNIDDHTEIQKSVSFINSTKIEVPEMVSDESFEKDASKNGLSKEDIDLFDDKGQK